MNRAKYYITNKLKRELVLKIKPDMFYPVNYTIKQDGTKVYGAQKLKGGDLTENQIIDIWILKQETGMDFFR